jgi:hypothetical protein
LQSLELSRLAQAANLGKKTGALLDQWMEENAAAMLARLLLQQRDRSVRSPDMPSEAESRHNGAPSASDNFLADRAASQPLNRGHLEVLTCSASTI